MSEFVEVPIVATCHTDGCVNADVPAALIWLGEADAPPYVLCGACGEQITDVHAESETPAPREENADEQA